MKEATFRVIMKESTFKVIGINRHRISTDGSGITTLVGLVGCPLSCKYCINKELLQANKVKELTAKQLLDIISIDYSYFIATNGGITFGGGEPLLQYRAIQELIQTIKKEINYKLNINIETSLNIQTAYLKHLLADINELIIDIKDINSVIYNEYTAKNNSLVLKNLKYISKQNMQSKCLIRIPLIPNYNTEQDIKNSVEFIKKLGYKNLDIFKYKINKEK